ncbi:MAG: hypothetical protein CVT98_00845 [Bacteroidetes bacterium HGW-Bacteroidetes-15]|nr:MAG: hypothetical protein CVT98_00845 [Bacteroidetes bacterium HGW-Bacteroidetes-15]
MTVFRKFEVCASYESSVVKSPPSPSRKTLPVRRKIRFHRQIFVLTNKFSFPINYSVDFLPTPQATASKFKFYPTLIFIFFRQRRFTIHIAAHLQASTSQRTTKGL